MKEVIVDGVTYYGVEMIGAIVTENSIIITVDVDGMSDEEIEKLPGSKYIQGADYSPKYRIADEEMIEWLTENVKQTYRVSTRGFYFDNTEDAVAFKLRWT